MSILIIRGINASADYDITKVSRRTTLGLRAGIERYAAGLVESVDGSPFQDLDLLARSTTSGSRFRWDIYTGITSHRSIESSAYASRTAIRFGMDFRYYLMPHYCALLLKLNTGAMGIGLSIGYDTQ